MNSLDYVKKIMALADDSKARDPVVLDLRKISIVTDYFVILTGTSRPHVLSIIEHIQEGLEMEDISPWQQEGDADARWMLLDYGDVVVHVFQADTRRFYNLERLWNDAKQVQVEWNGFSL